MCSSQQTIKPEVTLSFYAFCKQSEKVRVGQIGGEESVKLKKRKSKKKMSEVVGVVTGLTTELFEINQVSQTPKISLVKIKL